MSRSPIQVTITRGLYSADVLLVRAKRGVRVGRVQISREHADPLLRPHLGDGVASQRSLRSEFPMLIFLLDARDDSAVYSTSDPRVVRIKVGETVTIRVDWTHVDGHLNAGSLIVVWTSRDRRDGKNPFVIAGNAATDVSSAMRSGAQGSASALWRPRPRVRFEKASKWRWLAERKMFRMDEQHSIPRVASLTVRGFRGFRETAEFRLAIPNGLPGSGLTIIVGANNVGKSTLWESFDALARRFNSDRWPGYEVSFSEGKRNRKTTEHLRISAKLHGGAECAIESIGPDTSETRALWSPEDEVPPRTPSFVVVPSRRQFQARFSRGAQATPTWMTTSGEFSRYQSRDGFTARLFDLHANPAKKAAFDKLLEEVIGSPLEWSIDLADGDHGNSYYLKVSAGSDSYYTSEGLGEGIVSLLFVLNALYDADSNTVVVIDEPELSLHPQLVRRLGDVLARSAQDTQVVIFTHSPMLISWDAIANGAAVARVFRRGNDSKVAQADPAVLADISNLRGSWNNPHIIGLDAKEAFFLEDGLIVLEGQDDAALLPRVASLAHVELKGAVYGWGAGGEGNIEKVLALFRSLGFARIAAVFDNNVPDKVERVRLAFPDYHVTTIPAADIRTKKSEKARVEKPGLLDKSAEGFANATFEESTRNTLEAVNTYLTGE